MRLITVFEHQTLRQSDFYNPADFAWVLAQIDRGKLPCFNISYAGQVVVKVGHYLAVIRLPSGTVLEILPKISKDTASNHNQTDDKTHHQTQTRRWVSLMLSDIYDLSAISVKPLFALASADNKLTHNNPQASTWLLPIIEAWFGLVTQLPVLLPRHYQQATQNNPQAQGKLLIKQQISHNAHRPHYRYTCMQQLDLHPLWGQFFTTALHKVQSLGITTMPEVTQAVYSIATANSVNILQANQWQHSYQQLKQLLINTDAQRDKHCKQQLGMAIELAWLILQMQETPANPVAGNEVVPAVMINMQQAFERWVSLKITQHYHAKSQKNKYKNQVQVQARFAWIGNMNDDTNLNEQKEQHSRQRYLQPDIVVYHPNDTIAVVADVKYKQINEAAQVNTADLYQLYTYYQHLQSAQAWLIYPTDSQNKKSWQKTQWLQILPNLHNNNKNLQQIKLIPFDVNTGELLVDG